MYSYSGKMSDSLRDRESGIQSSLPPPPLTYINLYTDENIRRGRAPKPPPIPPSHETYSMFGTQFHADDAIIRPLESQVACSPITLVVISQRQITEGKSYPFYLGNSASLSK